MIQATGGVDSIKWEEVFLFFSAEKKIKIWTIFLVKINDLFNRGSKHFFLFLPQSFFAPKIPTKCLSIMTQ